MALHLMGYPLSRTQGELTNVQRAFLLHALPPAIRKMNGAPEPVAGQPPAAAREPDYWERMRELKRKRTRKS